MTKPLIIFLAIFRICKPEVQILDYTGSQLIPIHLGQARLQNGNFKLIHTLDLIKYEETVNCLSSEIQTKIFRNSSALPFLLHDIRQVEDHLKRLKPRSKRSINLIGTAWKWIAGTPDHEDHQIVVDKINGLLTNNELQRIINKDAIDKINILTETTNEILKTVQSLEETRKTIEETIASKIKIIKEEITNIEYALQWAKVGVVNSFLLSEKEMDEARIFLDSKRFPYNSLEEALGFADIRVATNNAAIIYIVSLPAINEISCEKLLIKAVKKNNKIIKLNTVNYIRCKNDIYEIKEKCQQINDLSICRKSKLLNLSNTKCVTQILLSKHHNCTIVNNQHVPSVEEIYPGTILLNQFKGLVRIAEANPFELSGTYLIQFHNDTIQIENETYISKELPFSKPLPAVLQLSGNKTQVEEFLSLEMIKDLQINNIKQISSISTKEKWMLSINSIIFLILFSTMILLICKTKRILNPEVKITNVLSGEPGRSKDLKESIPDRICKLEIKPEFRSVNDLPVL